MRYDANPATSSPTESQIEKDSYYLRVWMFQSVIQGIPEDISWYDSMVENTRTSRHRLMEWFNAIQVKWGCEGQAITADAIRSLAPDNYLSGDAINLVLKAFRFVPRPGCLVLDCVSSQLDLHSLKHNTSAAQIFKNIVMTINVTETHWYMGSFEAPNSSDFRCTMFHNCPNLVNQVAESILRDLGQWYITFVSTQRQRTNCDTVKTPNRTVKLRRRTPTGYQLVKIERDENCLFNAIMDGMINHQLQIPFTWVTQDNWTRGQSMRTTLVRLCNGGYRVLARYKHLRETLEAKGDGGNSLFQEMFIRISTGKYGQDSKRE